MLNRETTKWDIEEESEFAQRILQFPKEEVMTLFKKFKCEFAAKEEDILEYLEVNVFVLFREAPKAELITAVEELEKNLQNFK